MDLPALAWLRSPPGQRLLAELHQRDLDERTILAELTRLRRFYPPELARAALELSLLRRRARGKFPAADHMFFIREALEQASSAAVAAQRADRLRSYASMVGDLCCGIGSDALAFAAAGMQVLAVDRDPLRLALAHANAEALHLDQQITFLERDLLHDPPPIADALFCDPGRRAGGKRRFAVEAYEPPLSLVLQWQIDQPALTVKLAPGVDLHDLPTTAEVEFVSLNGELKEARLWCGPLVTAQRRASLLREVKPSPYLQAPLPVQSFTLTDTPQLAPCPLSPPLAYLYEPDPAVIRAGLVTGLATRIGAAQLDRQIAYLTASHFVETPFAQTWRINEWFPFNLKRLRSRLRELDAGTVTVKKRGSPLDTDTLARQLSGNGAQPRIVVLTRCEDRPVALLVEPVDRLSLL